MVLNGSSVLSLNYGECNIAENFQMIRTEPRSEVQIQNDSCHFWCEPNIATISNLQECITDFCFSIFRYFTDEVLDLAIARDNEYLARSSLSNTPDNNQQKSSVLLLAFIFFILSFIFVISLTIKSR
jgi:hypothetical protein